MIDYKNTSPIAEQTISKSGEITNLLDEIQKQLEVQLDLIDHSRLKLNSILCPEYPNDNKSPTDGYVETEIGNILNSILSKLVTRNSLIMDTISRIRL